MNILMLKASPREKGVTSVLIDEIEKSIASKHFVETILVYKSNMKPCVGCLKCRPDKKCVLPNDDAHTLAEKVKDSDLLIIGCPVYWGNIPGPLKIFFDRNVTLFEYVEAKATKRTPRPRLKGKKAILVVSSGAPFPYNLLASQSRGTIRALRTILKAGGIAIDKVLNIPDSYNFDKNKEKYLKKARNIGISI
jgi:multimeric flavodoxin WrbA